MEKASVGGQFCAIQITNLMTTKNWNTALWTAQASMAALFGMAGLMKSTAPISELRMMIPWVADAPALARVVGVSELLGAIALLLPSLLRIRPMVTILAARMLGLVMISAMAFHIVRGEYPMLGVNMLFLAVMLFIAYGRTRKAVIATRGEHMPSTL